MTHMWSAGTSWVGVGQEYWAVGWCEEWRGVSMRSLCVACIGLLICSYGAGFVNSAIEKEPIISTSTSTTPSCSRMQNALQNASPVEPIGETGHQERDR